MIANSEPTKAKTSKATVAERHLLDEMLLDADMRRAPRTEDVLIEPPCCSAPVGTK